MNAAHKTLSVIFDEQMRRYHKPTWIALMVLILCLADIPRMQRVAEYKKEYSALDVNGNYLGVYRVSDATDIKYYRLAAMGDFSQTTPKGITWFTYPRFTAIFWKPLTWVSLPVARILNHIVLSLCVMWMAWKVIAFPGGWLIAIFGTIYAKYSLDYGNVYPLLCALSMTFCGGYVALLMKPYMAIFPILHLLSEHAPMPSKRLRNLLIGLAITLAAICSLLSASGVVWSILYEAPDDFFIHPRQFILIFPTYYLLWKYIPKSWWQ